MITRILLPMLILTTLTGCLTTHLYRLTALDQEQVIWRTGSEYVTLNYEGVFLESSYVESYEDFHVFFVHVRNESYRNVLIDPSIFYYKIDSYLPDLYYTPQMQIGDTLRAEDPELKILELDYNISQQVAKINQAQSTSRVSKIVDDIVENFKPEKNKLTKEEKEERRKKEAQRIAKFRQEMAERENMIMTMSEKKEFWTNDALRKNTLFPGYEAGGFVFFLRNNSVGTMTVNFQINNIDYPIAYKQFKFTPNVNQYSKPTY